MSRYAVGQVVPVIGLYTVDADRGFRQFSSLQTIVINIILHNLDIEDVRFRILPVVVEKEHQVPVEWCEDRKVAGYTGVVNQELFNDFRFANQYPSASYGQTSTTGDNMWRIIPREQGKQEIIGGLEHFLKNEIPLHYTELVKVMDELYTISHEGNELHKDADSLLMRIMTNIECFHKNWQVEQQTRAMDDFKWKEFQITVN